MRGEFRQVAVEAERAAGDAAGDVVGQEGVVGALAIHVALVVVQVRGQAGEHQVPDAKVALGHAYGGGSQFFSMWIVSSEKP